MRAYFTAAYDVRSRYGFNPFHVFQRLLASDSCCRWNHMIRGFSADLIAVSKDSPSPIGELYTNWAPAQDALGAWDERRNSIHKLLKLKVALASKELLTSAFETFLYVPVRDNAFFPSRSGNQEVLFCSRHLHINSSIMHDHPQSFNPLLYPQTLADLSSNMTGYIQFKLRRGALCSRRPSRAAPLESHSGNLEVYPPRHRSRVQALFESGKTNVGKRRTTRRYLNQTYLDSKNNARQLLRSITFARSEYRDTVATRVPLSSDELGSDAFRGAEMAVVETSGSGRPRLSLIVGGPVSRIVYRPSLAENVGNSSTILLARNATNPTATGYSREEKPLASGNGVSFSIFLAEPVLFLQGLDQSEPGNYTTTILTGSFYLRISKSAKLKAVSLKFHVRAETKWPEGISTCLYV